MKKILHLVLALTAAVAFAQTPKENLQRAMKTNTVTGTGLGVPFQVETIAALKAVTVANVTNGQQVNVVCYAASGDGGGGQFYYSSASAATANDGTIIAPTSGSGRWLRVYSGVINVKWFGAGGGAVTDDTAEIQAAINAAEVIGRADVYLPAGQYVVSSTLTVDSPGVSIKGDGQWNTRIRRSTNHGDTFYFTGNDGTGAVVYDVGISDLGFSNEGLMTSGAHIHWNGVFHGSIQNVYMKDGFEGVVCEAVTGSNIDNLNLVFDNNYTGSATNRMYMRFSQSAGAYAHPMCGDVLVSNFNLRNGSSTGLTQYGIYINSGDGIWFSNGHVGGASGTNCTFINAGYMLTLVFFDNVMFDAGTASSNVLFQGSHASNVGSGIQFSNCYLAGGDGITYGVNFGSGTDFYGVLFNNTTITGHKASGVFINSTDLHAITFNNCAVRGNSRNPTNSNAGYNFEANCGNVSILGGNSGGPEGIGGSDTQSWGVLIAAGTGNNIMVNGVDVSGNVSGSIISLATGDNVHFVNSYDGTTNTVASASTVTLPFGQPIINVSGTTNISTITAAGSGTTATLIFADVLTVNDGSNLKLAGNFTTAANASLSVICDGTNWIETGRSTN